MTEILTESFCERCGTRYTFESNAPRRSRIGRVRTFSKGVRNFVLSDESSFSEAMADARGEEEIAATAHQLDAFHKTFNFCLTCRQYTCGECWNVTDGRCLTCAPLPGMEDQAGALAVGLAVALPSNGHGEALSDEAWPEADLSSDRLVRALGAGAAVPEQPGDDFAAIAAASAAAHVVEPEAFPADLVFDEDAFAVDGVDLVVPGGLDAEPADEAVGLPEAAQPADAAALTEAVEPAGAVDVPEAAAPAEAEAPVEVPAVVEPAALPEAFDEDAPLAAAGAVAFASEPAEETEPQVIGMAPGQSLEDAIAAYEAQLAADEAVAPEEEQDRAGIGLVAAAGLAAAMAPTSDLEAGRPDEIEEIPDIAARLAGTPIRTPHAAPEPVEAAAPAEAVPATPEPPRMEPVAPEPAAFPVAAEAAVPEPEVAAPALAAPVKPEPEPAATGPEAPRVDVVQQPTWPAATPAGEPAAPTPPAQAPAPAAAPWLMTAPEEAARPAQGEPQWPATPTWRPPTTSREVPTTLAGRLLLPQSDASALWAASAREVLGPAPASLPQAAAVPTPQPCVQCGLSLSANARFCRRCGTRQA